MHVFTIFALLCLLIALKSNNWMIKILSIVNFSYVITFKICIQFWFEIAIICLNMFLIILLYTKIIVKFKR